MADQSNPGEKLIKPHLLFGASPLSRISLGVFDFLQAGVILLLLPPPPSPLVWSSNVPEVSGETPIHQIAFSLLVELNYYNTIIFERLFARHYQRASTTTSKATGVRFCCRGFLCCLIPLCCDGVKDIIHHCPQCGGIIGFHRRI